MTSQNEVFTTSLIYVLIATFGPVRFILSPKVSCLSDSLRFVIFSSKCTMFDVLPESAINVSLSWSLFDAVMINSSTYITSYMSLFADVLRFFSCSNLNHNPLLCY